MKLKDLKKSIEQLVESNPEAAELEVFQTSCFDEPERYESSNVFVDEVFIVTDNGEVMSHHIDHPTAEQRAGDEGGKVTSKQCVVIEAY